MSAGNASGSATDSNGNSGTAAPAGVCVDTGNSAHPTSATVRTRTLTTTSTVGNLLREIPRDSSASRVVRLHSEALGDDSSGRLMSQRPNSLAITALVVAAGYYVGAQIGLSLTFAPATTSVLWPPNAILTAALLMTPPRSWWVCVFAALPAHILLEIGAGFSSPLVGLLFVTNCSEALLAAIAVRALSDAPTRFDSFRRVAAFIGGAGLVAPIVSSFAEAPVVSSLRDESYWDVWRVRVFANVLTELSVVPAIILGWRAARRMLTQAPSARRVAETLAFVVALTAIAVVVFGRPTASDAIPRTLP